MSALFKWKSKVRNPDSYIGQERLRVGFLFWPKKLDDQWRWLGFEEWIEEYQQWRDYVPELGSCDVVGWRAVGWDYSKERFQRQRLLAAQMWRDAGGHIRSNGGGLIHEFIVASHGSYQEYMDKAEAVIAGKPIQ